MTTIDTPPNGMHNAGTPLGLGLIAAGAGILLRDPEVRATCARITHQLRLDEIGRKVLAEILSQISASLSGRDAIGAAR